MAIVGQLEGFGRTLGTNCQGTKISALARVAAESVASPAVSLFIILSSHQLHRTLVSPFPLPMAEKDATARLRRAVQGQLILAFWQSSSINP